MISDAELRQLTEGPIENRTIAISGYRTVEMAKEILLLRTECRAAREFADSFGKPLQPFNHFKVEKALKIFDAARAETDSAGVVL